jgi:hypothetical protein
MRPRMEKQKLRISVNCMVEGKVGLTFIVARLL